MECSIYWDWGILFLLRGLSNQYFANKPANALTKIWKTQTSSAPNKIIKTISIEKGMIPPLTAGRPFP
jgi:hypothetical protein